MEKQYYKNKNIGIKHFKKYAKQPFFKGKKIVFQSTKKVFIELKDRELQDREENIKREVEKLFFKPIIVSKDDTDNFEEQ